MKETSELLREELRWAYETELRRVERTDTLGTALVATTVPTGALMATVLKDYELTGTGEALIKVAGGLLFLSVLLALWARFAFLPWTESRAEQSAAHAVAPAKSVRQLVDPLEGRPAADVERALTDAWRLRLSGASLVATQKIAIAFFALLALVMAAGVLGGALLFCAEG